MNLVANYLLVCLWLVLQLHPSLLLTKTHQRSGVKIEKNEKGVIFGTGSIRQKKEKRKEEKMERKEKI